jgi:hypothetical protein
MSMDVELARQIVERHALPPGRHVESVHEEPVGVVVETDTLPRVVREAAPPFGSLAVYEIGPAYNADPPKASVGVVVMNDGESFHLNEDEEFLAFWAATGGEVEPDVLADLLAAYHSGENPGHVVGSGRVPVARRRAAQVAAVDGCEALSSEQSGRHLRVRFCSWSIAPEPTGEDVVVVVRWDVDAEQHGPIAWAITPLADLPAD